MISILVIALCAVLNRVRGGGFTADRWPGHARLWASAGMLGLLLVAPLPLACAWAVAFFLWSVPALNRWDTLNRRAQPDPRTWSEAFFEVIAGHLGGVGDHSVLTARHTLSALPGLVLVAFVSDMLWLPVLALPFGVAAMLATDLAAEFRFPNHRPIAEPLVGALWGVLIVFTL